LAQRWSKGQGHQAALLTTAFTHQADVAVTVERIHCGTGNLLLRCAQVQSALQSEALRRPQMEERGGGILLRLPHSLFKRVLIP